MSGPRCYTVDDVQEKLQLARTAFYRHWRAGDLPFLVELQPRIGRKHRFRADLVDAYLNGEGLAAVRQLRLLEGKRHVR